MKLLNGSTWVHSTLYSSCTKLLLAICFASGIIGHDNPSNQQYHIQTDEGPERYFRYQTLSGQFRKEKRLEDGTVIGTYAWIDDDGILRQRDYIADHAGYRITKSKNLYVGRNIPVGEAVKLAKKYTSSADALISFKPRPSGVNNEYNQATQKAGVKFAASPYDDLPAYNERDQNSLDYNSYVNPLNQGVFFQNGPTYPIDRNGHTYRGNKRFSQSRTGNGYNGQHTEYDGVSVTNDGFRYYIPRAYHEEETNRDNEKSGSFGYIDPFGIRRVIYYNAKPGQGFQHRKNNRYVGFDATPYDPRP
ncbi:hypothetical protein YQE_02831, partial [Dendroctonus ponderosae]